MSSMMIDAWLQQEIEDLPMTGTWEGNPRTALAGKDLVTTAAKSDEEV